MGIKNLLQTFKHQKKEKNLKDFQNQRVAVDGYVWMHRAIYTINNDKDAKKITKFVNYFKEKINKLHEYNIKVIIVWDGDKIKMKEKTNNERYLKRKENYQKAVNLYQQKKYKESIKYFRSSMKISPLLVNLVQRELRQFYQDKVQFILAPYEADSQLAYLCQQNIVDFVISEDSDLLVFGAKNCFYKMDREYNGDLFNIEDIKNDKDLGFKNFNQSRFIELCILTGCDYLKPPSGIAYKTAYKLYKKHGSISSIMADSRHTFPDDYFDNFVKSFLTFRFMWVYCPRQNKIVNLNPLDENLNSKDDTDNFYLQYAKSQNWIFDFYGIKKPAYINNINNKQYGKDDPLTNTSFISKYSQLIENEIPKNNQDINSSFQYIMQETEKDFIQTDYWSIIESQDNNKDQIKFQEKNLIQQSQDEVKQFDNNLNRNIIENISKKYQATSIIQEEQIDDIYFESNDQEMEFENNYENSIKCFQEEQVQLNQDPDKLEKIKNQHEKGLKQFQQYCIKEEVIYKEDKNDEQIRTKKKIVNFSTQKNKMNKLDDVINQKNQNKLNLENFIQQKQTNKNQQFEIKIEKLKDGRFIWEISEQLQKLMSQEKEFKITLQKIQIILIQCFKKIFHLVQLNQEEIKKNYIYNQKDQKSFLCFYIMKKKKIYNKMFLIMMNKIFHKMNFNN